MDWDRKKDKKRVIVPLTDLDWGDERLVLTEIIGTISLYIIFYPREYFDDVLRHYSDRFQAPKTSILKEWVHSRNC